jgi:arylsulfatase A-like enzyme
MYMHLLRATVLLAVVISNVQTLAADTQPNIVVIVGDDMGYADIGVHGCQDIPTPHIDALAAAGVHCTSGYVSAPYCSPTRAGLLTGRYQTRFGHEFNPGDGRFGNDKPATRKPIGLPLSETTIADRFKAAGYATGWVGKWHLGSGPQFIPQRRGFAECLCFGFLGGAHGYFPGAKPAILRDNQPIEEKEYLTDAIGREAVAFIDRHRDQPFFLYLAFNAVHTPLNATDERLEKFNKIGDKNRRTYAGMMSAMDDAIGRVPTMPGTATNASRNDPLRGSKRTTLEGGIRVPFFVKWPGHVPAGKVYDRPVIQLDILPTALAAADVRLPANARADGVDLLPYLSGKNEDQPHPVLYWRFGEQMAIRQGDWKLVRYDPVVDGMKGRATKARLYNLANDIGESKDLIEAEPQKAKALQAAWDEWNQSNLPPLWGGAGKAKKKAARPRSQASIERAAEAIVLAE